MKKMERIDDYLVLMFCKYYILCLFILDFIYGIKLLKCQIYLITRNEIEINSKGEKQRIDGVIK